MGGASNSALVRVAAVIVTAVCALSYFFVKPVNSAVNLAVFMLNSTNIEMTAGYIRSFGGYAAIASFLLMMLQAVAVPLPAQITVFSNAAVFGWELGALLSWSGAMAGAALCFFISRVLGRGIVNWFTGKKMSKKLDAFFGRYGWHAVLACRLLPFAPFDLVSYALGLTAISLKSFLIATGIGLLPMTLVYSYSGRMLTGVARTAATATSVISALVVTSVMLKIIYTDKTSEKKRGEQNHAEL